MRPYLEEVDHEEVEFISVESRSRVPMKLFKCVTFSLVQVEAARRSTPCTTYIVENSKMTTFPVLMGLQTMSDMNLEAAFRTGIVRDPEGIPYRLYNRRALPKLSQSLAVLTRKWSRTRRPTVVFPSAKEGTQVGAAKSLLPTIPDRPTSTRDSAQKTTVAPIGKVGKSPHSMKRRSTEPDPAGKRKGTLSKGPVSWSATDLKQAEESNDRRFFAHLCLHHVNQLQKYLVRHPEKFQSAFPNLFEYVEYRKAHSPWFQHQWSSLWQQRVRLQNKVSRRKDTYHVEKLTHDDEDEDRPRGRLVHRQLADRLHRVRSQPAIPLQTPSGDGFSVTNLVRRQQARWAQTPTPTGSQEPKSKSGTHSGTGSSPRGVDANQDKLTPGLGKESKVIKGKDLPFDPGGRGDSPKMSTSQWEWDPTPPHLAKQHPRLGSSLPDAPVHLHPDFADSLNRKAEARWHRGFSMYAQAGRSRRLKKDASYRPWAFGENGRGGGEASLIIPSAKRVEAVLKSLLQLRQRSSITSALLLMPEDYVVSDDVKAFLHAYCIRGEVYRYGKLFRRTPDGEYMHLNQSVTEYWYDGESIFLAALTDKQRDQLDNLTGEFEDVIGDEFDRKKQPDTVPYVRLPVKPDYEPASQSPFKKNPKMRDLIVKFVLDLERKGLISRCTNNEAVFVCNPLCLPKGPDRHRFVCTFKDLNENLLKDPYGMRTMDSVMSSLEGNSWFTTIDLVDGFFSLPLYPADRGYTAFHTPIGLFKWDVLPQGTAASPAIFQRVMDRWFARFLWTNVIVWIDDVLVFSKSFEEHLVALRGVFQVLRKYGLVASRRKLKLCMRSVRYLGFIFGVHGIRTDPDKVAAVHGIPTPHTRKQVRQFLGFANFYRRFLPPNYATVVAPRTHLTSEKNEFEWTDRCTYAFNKVKLLLTSTPVLVHPNFDLPFHIHCDASGLGVGAVLSQYVDGAYRPIAYCSKKLLPHQTHWAPAQLEAYAIYHAVVEKWRYYLSLTRCIVHSDHRNLIWLLDHSHKGMIGRWYTSLSAFDLDITYVSGKSQLVADPLSRMFARCENNTYDPATNPALHQNKIKSAAGHLSYLATDPPRCGVLSHSAGRRSCLYASPSWVSAFPADTKLPANLRNVVQSIISDQLPRNIPRAVWASHQQSDPRLKDIY